MYQELQPARSEYVPIRQLNYHVRLWGPDTSALPPLVLVHGWMDVSASYQFVVDAFYPDDALVVQFDGDYWHDRTGTSTEPRIRKRVALDDSQDAYMGACGLRVVRYWGSTVTADPAAVEQSIRDQLRPPAADAPQGRVLRL